MLFAGSGQLFLNGSSSISAVVETIHLQSKVFDLPQDWEEFCAGFRYDINVDSYVIGELTIELYVPGSCCNIDFKNKFQVQTCRNCTWGCTIKTNGTHHIKVRYTFVIFDRHIGC